MNDISPPSPVTRQWLSSLRSALDPSVQGAPHWYVILTAAVASAHLSAEAVPLLYDMAIEEHAPRGIAKHDNDAIAIQRNIKEALLKGSVLYGIPAALDGVMRLLPLVRRDVERDPARADAGFFLRRNQTIDGSSARGHQQLQTVYQANLPEIQARMGDDMNDLRTLTFDVNYGWILSENTLIDFALTELLILAALVAQNLRLETLWHLRGSRRAGWNDAVIDSVRTVAIRVARDAGLRTDKVPSLDEVREDSNELDGK